MNANKARTVWKKIGHARLYSIEFGRFVCLEGHSTVVRVLSGDVELAGAELATRRDQEKC